MAINEAIGVTPETPAPQAATHGLGELTVASVSETPLAEGAHYADADISAFVDFASGIGLAEPVDADLLQKTIYNDFYHKSGNTVFAPSLEQMQGYSDASIQAARTIRDTTEEENLDVKYSMSLGWQAYLVNEGYDTSKPVGRLYLNTTPEATNPTLVELTTRLARANVRVDIKAALAVNDDDNVCITHRGLKEHRDNFPVSELDSDDMTEIFNRADKIVIYVNSDNASQVIDTISGYCTAHPEAMEASAPHFTKPIIESDGSKIPGVGFAEEPAVQSRELRRKLRAQSYGDFISGVLAYVLTENGLHGDMQNTVSQTLADYNRNPQDPALNEPSAFDIA